MSALSQYDGWTTAEIVRRNSHELTAMHLLQAAEELREQARERDAAVAGIRSLMDRVHRIGTAVLKAESSGRKTVRISDLTGGA